MKVQCRYCREIQYVPYYYDSDTVYKCCPYCGKGTMYDWTIILEEEE